MTETLTVLAYSNSKKILSHLNDNDEKRFSEISSELKLNPNIVDRRLKDLTDKGLVKKLDKKIYRN